jgi:hypothetical protein
MDILLCLCCITLIVILSMKRLWIVIINCFSTTPKSHTNAVVVSKLQLKIHYYKCKKKTHTPYLQTESSIFLHCQMFNTSTGILDRLLYILKRLRSVYYVIMPCNMKWTVPDKVHTFRLVLDISQDVRFTDFNRKFTLQIRFCLQTLKTIFNRNAFRIFEA